MGHPYKDLVVWQKSIAMVTEIYRATQTFPKGETYGLTSQLRRSAVSVASNIAEGQGRLSKKEFRHFLGMARGSIVEMETQVLISRNLGYLSEVAMDQLMKTSGQVSPPSSRPDAIAPTRRNQKLETRNQKRRSSPVLN
jgi:four helix bundle protein